jgi:CBS domain-containing protein
LVSARLILRELTRNPTKRTTRTVEDIMVTDIVTVTEETTIKEAIRLMREHDIGCLPVVVNGVDLVGLITENDFIRISRRLIERMD